MSPGIFQAALTLFCFFLRLIVDLELLHLQSILPATLEEFQRLRCRVAFHALKFRPEIRALGNQIVSRLRVSGRPYLAYHPGLLRDTLAFHGCAELFQDIHTELIQYRRNQMIKRGTVKEQLSVDSVSRKINGSCPLMPEEVSLFVMVYSSQLLTELGCNSSYVQF
jgi:hypothetical protein